MLKISHPAPVFRAAEVVKYVARVVTVGKSAIDLILSARKGRTIGANPQSRKLADSPHPIEPLKRGRRRYCGVYLADAKIEKHSFSKNFWGAFFKRRDCALASAKKQMARN